MISDGFTVNWILAIIGATLTGLLYLVCCLCSIQKAIKDRQKIIDRNCAKRNEKYLKEMGIDSDKIGLKNNKNTFAISKRKETNENPLLEMSTVNSVQLKSETSNYPLTKARKINLDDIEEILNESISINPSTNSSTVGKAISEHSQPTNPLGEKGNNSDVAIVTNLRKPVIIESVPKYYYLKAHNSHTKEKALPSNWITERLNNAGSFVEAQRQLQYGTKRAPLAKQNSGFSSMDEDSSASYNC